MEAISRVVETVDNILNNTKLLAGNVNDIFSNTVSERNELDQLMQQQNADPIFQEMINQKRTILSNGYNDILAKMKGWIQNMNGARELMQVLINYTDTLVTKFANDNRLSVSLADQESADAVVPEFIPNASIQKTEDQLISKFEFVISRLVELWRCCFDFNRQLNDLAQSGVISKNDYHQLNNSVPVILEFIKIHLPHILAHSVIISKQPPLVILRDAVNRNTNEPKNGSASRITSAKEQPKCQTSFDLELKVYTSNTLNKFYPPTALGEVTVTMITEEDAIKVARREIPKAESVGDLTCSTQPFKAMPANGGFTIWTASFTNMRIRKIKREKAKCVENMRYCMLFEFRSVQPVSTGTNFNVDLNMSMVSLPFCVIVNPNQRPKVMPPIFWSRAFSPLENSILQANLNDPVPWPLFKERLNELFNIGTGAIKMSDDQMQHLAKRLFGPQMSYNTCPVTFDIFCKNQLPDTLGDDEKPPLTFWEWFYSFMETVGNKKFRPYWNESLILGFVSRENANALLAQLDNEPCVLIKFSDSTKGTLVMSFYLPVYQKEVIHMTVDDFGGRELGLYQCFEKLCIQYPYLKKVKQIVYGYQTWERKPIEELARINASDPRNRRGPGTEEQAVKKKTCPYVKAEWQLCLQHPDLHKFLQNMSQDGNGGAVVPNAPSPFDAQSRNYSNPSSVTSGMQSPESWVSVSSPQNLNCQMNGLPQVAVPNQYHQQAARVVPIDMNQFQPNDFFQNYSFNLQTSNNNKDIFEGTTLRTNFDAYALSNGGRAGYPSDSLELSPTEMLHDEFNSKLEFPDELIFNV